VLKSERKPIKESVTAYLFVICKIVLFYGCAIPNQIKMISSLISILFYFRV